MKAYLIVPVAWEYNDQNYFIQDPEFGFNPPEKLCKTLEEATKIAREKNIKSFRSTFKVYSNNMLLANGNPKAPITWTYQTSLSEYISDDMIESDCIDLNELQKMFDELGMDADASDNYGDWKIPETITDEQILILLDITHINFYEIVEVEI